MSHSNTQPLLPSSKSSSKLPKYTPLENPVQETAEITLERNIYVIKTNMSRTLDPKAWTLNDVSPQEIANNIKRNVTVVSALTALEKIKVNGKEVTGDAVSFDQDDNLILGNKVAYLGMGGRVINELNAENGNKILPAMFAVPTNEDLPVSKGFDNIEDNEQKNGTIARRRKTSTHIINPKNGDEDRGFWVGANTLARTSLRRAVPTAELALSADIQSFQIGVDLTVGGLGNKSILSLEKSSVLNPSDATDVEQSLKNKKGEIQTINGNGSYGHMLMILQKVESDTHPVTLMIGIENTAYGAENILSQTAHDIRGKAGKTSPFLGNKHKDFTSEQYQGLNLVKPSLTENGEPINSMRSEIDDAVLKKIQENAEKYKEFALKSLSLKQGLTEEKIAEIKTLLENKEARTPDPIERDSTKIKTPKRKSRLGRLLSSRSLNKIDPIIDRITEETVAEIKEQLKEYSYPSKHLVSTSLSTKRPNKTNVAHL